MKVIFLDIDGVLNCRSTPNPRNFPYVIDATLSQRLGGVLERTGAQVVLSSTWRFDPVGLFAARHFGVSFIDTLPDMPRCARRDEIVAWLEANPATTRFAVIDDEDDELDELPLFQPSAKNGLDEKTAEAVVRYLEGDTDADKRANRLVRFVENAVAALRGHRG